MRRLRRETPMAKAFRLLPALAGMLLGHKGQRIAAFNLPENAYTFENKRLGWETIAALAGPHLPVPVLLGVRVLRVWIPAGVCHCSPSVDAHVEQ